VPDVGRTAVPRVIIVDDESLARDCIRLALERHKRAQVVAECGDGIEAVHAIETLRPDLVFLDVQMPDVDGFGVIQWIGAAEMPAVVFVTAFDAHAIKAFEVHAVDYVLKPFDDARLLAAFDRACLSILDREAGALGRRLVRVLEGWQGGWEATELVVAKGTPAPRVAASEGREGGAAHITRFTIREGGSARFIAAAAVEWMEVEGNYVVLHVGSDAHRVRGTLREVLARLDPRQFVQIHKATIVNLARIRELQPWFGGDYVAVLEGGARLKVSRRRVGELLRPMA